MLKVKTFTVNPLQENCYIVSDETRECTIIDCGAWASEEQEEIKAYISSEGLKPVLLLATHGHFDHNWGVNAMNKAYGIKVSVHQSDEALLRDMPKQGDMFGFIVKETPAVGAVLKSNDTVSFGSHTLKCLPSPGHTPGGLVFYCEEEHVAFSGDTLFRQSIGRTDLPGGSMFMIINSLRYLCQLPDDVTVYPGHGPTTTIGFELAHNPYLDR